MITNRLKNPLRILISLTVTTWLGCGSGAEAGGGAGQPAAAVSGSSGAGAPASATGGAGAGSVSRAGAPASAAAGSGEVSGGALKPSEGSAGSGPVASTGSGSGSGGIGAAGTAAESVKLPPSIRNPKYPSLAPALGAPLPQTDAGTWSYLDVEGAVSRDGSPAGFFYKRSKTGNKNLLVYLAGGGVCADNFFCNMNPPNKSASLTAENVGSGVFNIFGPTQEAQDPTLPRWQSGIFKDDAANPVKDWNMVFIPYVTGDVFFGSKPNGTVPGVEGTFQFVGKANMQKFLGRIIPTFSDAELVLLSGSSAGGIGALLNATYLADGFIDQGKGARIFVLDDAGPFFDDAYLEVCIQQRYRDLYGLNDSFPADCPGCVDPSGGHLVVGVLQYLADKYPDRVLGGLVDSDQDEIMKFFFSEGIDNCMYVDNPLTGLLLYPADRYPKALANILQDVVAPSRMSSYIWSGSLHQNVFQTASGDRFYQNNGLDQTVAQWLGGLLAGKHERIGLVE